MNLVSMTVATEPHGSEKDFGEADSYKDWAEIVDMPGDADCQKFIASLAEPEELDFTI